MFWPAGCDVEVGWEGLGGGDGAAAGFGGGEGVWDCCLRAGEVVIERKDMVFWG